MVSSKPAASGGESIPCDFCSEQAAVLYCKADSAKLCLFCDQHVHGANLLSRKHVRSQICDNCASEAVAFRCSTDNLVLCHDCDWDAHGTPSVSAAHDRTPVEGFSGCPSPLELAALWGLDLHSTTTPPVQVEDDVSKDKNPDPSQNWDLVVDSSWTGLSFQDLIVPSQNNGGEAATKRQGSGGGSLGKHKQGIQKQLVELLKRDFDGGGDNLMENDDDANNNDGDDVDVNVNAEGFDVENGRLDGVNVGPAAVSQQQQQAPFTSLLMMAEGGVADRDMLWDTNARNTQTTPCTQIWDFNLGKLRSQEETVALDVPYGSGFMIKNFGELLKEASLSDTKVFGDMYQMDCSIGLEDIKFNGTECSLSQNPTNAAALRRLQSEAFPPPLKPLRQPIKAYCHKPYFGNQGRLCFLTNGVGACTEGRIEGWAWCLALMILISSMALVGRGMDGGGAACDMHVKEAMAVKLQWSAERESMVVSGSLEEATAVKLRWSAMAGSMGMTADKPNLLWIWGDGLGLELGRCGANLGLIHLFGPMKIGVGSLTGRGSPTGKGKTTA